jgi:hypothetical protein
LSLPTYSDATSCTANENYLNVCKPLYQLASHIYLSGDVGAYAAVAAKISTRRRALVATARQRENKIVKRQIKPILPLGLPTKAKTIIDNKGTRQENTIPRIFVVVSIRFQL